MAYSGSGAGTLANPYQITTLAQLNEVRDYQGQYWLLMNNIDASITSTWNGGAGWIPIGNPGEPFIGYFNGNGYLIDHLFIDNSDLDIAGLFGDMEERSTLSKLGLTNVDISSSSQNAYNWIGALVALSQLNTISECYATGSIVYTGTNGMVGGLFGQTSSSTILNCFSTVDVDNQTNDFTSYTAGLTGYGDSDSYTNCYSIGLVTTLGMFYGGMIAYAGSGVDCFWDTETSGQTYSSIGTGKTTAQMQAQATFVNWDFTTIWGINSNEYPGLRNVGWTSGGGTSVSVNAVTMVLNLSSVVPTLLGQRNISVTALTMQLGLNFGVPDVRGGVVESGEVNAEVFLLDITFNPPSISADWNNLVIESIFTITMNSPEVSGQRNPSIEPPTMQLEFDFSPPAVWDGKTNNRARKDSDIMWGLIR